MKFFNRYERLKRKIEKEYKNRPEELKIKLLEHDLEFLKISQFEFEIKILDITFGWMDERDPTKENYYKKKLKIQKEHGAITDEEYDRQFNTITNKNDEYVYKLEELAIDYKYNHISKHAYLKQKNELLGLPYVYVVDSTYDPENGISVFDIELDYNATFIKLLREEGFSGINDDEVIDEWFTKIVGESAMLSGMANPIERYANELAEIQSLQNKSMLGQPFVQRHSDPEKGFTEYS